MMLKSTSEIRLECAKRWADTHSRRIPWVVQAPKQPGTKPIIRATWERKV